VFRFARQGLGRLPLGLVGERDGSVQIKASTLAQVKARIVFKAHRPVSHSTPGLRSIKKKKKKKKKVGALAAGPCWRRGWGAAGRGLCASPPKAPRHSLSSKVDQKLIVKR